MWNLLPAVPAGLLGLGAAVSLVRSPGRERASAWAPVVAALLATLASVALLVHVSGPAGAASLRLPGWPEAIFGSPLFLRADIAVAWGLTLLCAMAVLTAARGAASPNEHRIRATALLAAASGALLLVLLASAYGLVLGWMLLDIVLYSAAGGRRHGLLAGQLGLMLAVVGLLSLPPAGFAAGASSAAGIAARPWLIAAGAVRMGVFPIWWAVPSARREHLWASGLIRLAPTLAGATLVIQASRLGPPPADVATGLGLPLAAVFFGGALAGLSRRHGRAMDWAMTHVAGLVLLASVLGDATGEAIALLLVAEVAVAGAGAYLIPRSPTLRTDRLAKVVLVLGMAGLPPLLGFAARWPLYRELWARGLATALIVTALGTAFALGGTLRRRPAPPLGLPPPPESRLRVLARVSTVVAVCAATAEVLLGLAFSVFAQPIAAHSRVRLPNPIVDLTSNLASTAGRGDVIVLLGLLLLPAILGLILSRTLGRTVDRGRLSALDLTPAVDAAASVVINVGALLQRVSGLVEERRALAWTLLATIAVALVPLRAPSEAAQLHTLGVLTLLACAIPAAAVALAGRPPVILASLASTYALCTGLLVATGTPWFIAGIIAMTGVFVLTILTVSVIQAPNVAMRPAAAARRLAALHGERDVGWNLVPALAVLVAVVVLAGVRSVVAADRLPDVVLQASLLLGAGGSVAVVLARGPLRLCTGVLVALTAFSLAYARLDPGLWVTGALAGFQLLFALVASFYVGESADELFAVTPTQSDPS